MHIPILLYHSIDTHAAPGFREWVISPALFDQHMAVLRSAGYTVLNAAQFVQMKKSGTLPTRPVVLTFDDGFADFYIHALPILEKYSLPATLYITTGYIGATSRWLMREGEGKRQMLTWDQIRELHAYRIDCGAHTRFHPHLDTMPLEAARREIFSSKETLEQQLGAAIYSFSYPYGHHIPATSQLAKEAGYTSACAVKNALSSLEDDVHALARITIYPTTTVKKLADIVAGKNLRVSPFPETLKTKVWRFVRRWKNRLGREEPYSYMEQNLSDQTN